MSAPDEFGTLRSVLVAGRHGAAGGEPVRIARRACDLVQIAARRGRAADLAERIRAAYSLDLPSPGHAAVTDERAVLWQRPDAWMLVAPPDREGRSAAGAAAACGDAGVAVDQTHGLVVLTMSGRQAPWVLAKLCRVDLHPRVFGPGRVAAAPIGELSCLLHQRDASPAFDVIVSATFAAAFAGMLTHAAEEVGYEVR